MNTATETNGLVDPNGYYNREWATDMTLAELSAAGGRVTRVRWLTEATPFGRFCDLSYVHGTLADGTPVRIRITAPQSMLVAYSKRKSALIEWAKVEGVYAKGLGLLDNESVLY